MLLSALNLKRLYVRVKCQLNQDIHHPGATKNTGQSVDGTVIATAWNGFLKGKLVALT
jgi:hypothetical protein